MRYILTPFCIVSAFRTEYDEAVNLDRDRMLREQLSARGMHHVPVVGHWNGEQENSALVLVPEDDDVIEVLKLAERYGQDAVLYVDNKRDAYVGSIQALRRVFAQEEYSELRSLFVGKWKEIPEAQAKKAANYTQSHDGRYWRAA